MYRYEPVLDRATLNTIGIAPKTSNAPFTYQSQDGIRLSTRSHANDFHRA
jgi:hypothetical protein